MATIIERVTIDNYHNLTDSDRVILRELDSIIEEIPNLNIQDTAERCFTSTTSFHRLIKKIGFKGFTDLKYQVIDYLEERKQSETFNSNSLDKLIWELQITKQINSKHMQMAANDVINCKDKYCFGTGWRQKQLIDNFANDVLYYGETIKTLRTVEDMAIAVEHMNQKSLVIIVSVHGKPSEELEEILSKCVIKGVNIISITSDAPNLLSETANHALFFKDSSVGRNKKHWTAIPLSFLLENLIQEIMEQKGYL